MESSSSMDSKRIAILAGAIGVFSTFIKVVGLLPEILVEQGAPGWLPTFGTVGQTVLLYTHGIEIVGALLPIVLGVGFGYYASQQLNLRDEYRRFLGAVVAGTTVPLLVAWIVGVGAFVFWISSVFNLITGTAMLLRLFATVSLPVIVGAFAGAAFAHFATAEYTPLEPDETNTDTTSTAR
jgi:hypothetical protein